MNIVRTMLDGVDVTGHRLREKLRVRKVPGGQVAVQLFVVAQGCHDRIEVQ